MLQRLYNLLILFREYVVLSVLLLVSLTLLALNDNPQMKRIRGITAVVFGVVQERLAIFPRYIGLRGENDELRRNNIELADEVSQLREARLENIRLRQLLGLKEFSPHALVAAKVIGKNITLLRNTITLNVGTRDSVLAGMPVVGDGGLVGIVSHASEQYSIVRVLLNTDFRASAKVQRSRVDGIIAWDGRSLLLTNITKTLDVRPGDVVITSEYSSTYPPNIRIGVVNDVQEQTGSLFKKVFITPGVDFVKLEEVFVMKYRPDPERRSLEQQATQRPRR
jgi:rod shape-determining protein MreC